MCYNVKRMCIKSSRREGSANKRGMRRDGKFINHYFIDYNLILRRSLPHPSEGRGVQIKRGMRIDGKFINHHFIDYNLIVNRL